MHRLRPAAIALGLVMPIAVLAAPPPVSGLSGTYEADGSVRVEWQPSPDSSVVRYRLYYSSESILGSEGIYDDFEETDGAETEFIFETPPTKNALYVTVLAVNSAGEESAAFVEEVTVDLSQPRPSESQSRSSDFEVPTLLSRPSMEPEPESPAPPVLTLPETAFSSVAQSSSVQTSIPTHTEPVSDGRAHLLLAEALSPIQVKMTFSGPVTVDPQAAPQAFSIVGPERRPLRITQILISEQIIVADTEQQMKGAVYNVKLSEPLHGINGEPLDATDRTAFFTGHEQGLDPVMAPISQPPIAQYDPMHPTDVVGFMLRASPESGGAYTVTAQWQPDAARGDIAHYLIRQTLDGGRTFSEPQTVAMDIAGVEFMGVQQGSFGVSLQVVNVYGGVSAGVFDFVTLPGGATPPPVTQGSVAVTNGQNMIPSLNFAEMAAQAQTDAMQLQQWQRVNRGDLPSSGIGLVAAGASLAGACMGWRKARKLKMPA